MRPRTLMCTGSGKEIKNPVTMTTKRSSQGHSWDNWGHLNVAWMLDNSRELLILVLGVIMVLWLLLGDVH